MIHSGKPTPTGVNSGDNQRFCNNQEQDCGIKARCARVSKSGGCRPAMARRASGEIFFPRCETILVLCCFREIVIDTFVVCVCLYGLQSWLSD